MPYLGARPTDVFADRDLNGQEFILDADADTSITADTDDQIDIRISGADDFQFTANTFTAQSGSTIAAQALTATTIGTGDGSAGSPSYTFTSDTDTGMFWVSAGILGWTSQGTEEMRLADQRLFLSDTANTGAAGAALTINQAHNDDEIFALKSSDVAHGRTSEAETDSYFIIKKQAAADGGAYIKAFTDDNFVCLKVLGYQRDANGTSPGTGVEGAINWAVKRHDGSNSNVNHDTNEIVYSWAAQKSGGGRAVMVLDSDGGLFLDDAVGSAFDDYDDAALLRTFSTHSAPADQIIKTEFDKWVGYNFKDLQAARIISDPDEGDGDPMWNIGQHTKLLTGAAVQQRAMFETMKSVAEEMLPGFAKKLNTRLAEQNLPALPVSAQKRKLNYGITSKYSSTGRYHS